MVVRLLLVAFITSSAGAFTLTTMSTTSTKTKTTMDHVQMQRQSSSIILRSMSSTPIDGGGDLQSNLESKLSSSSSSSSSPSSPSSPSSSSSRRDFFAFTGSSIIAASASAFAFASSTILINPQPAMAADDDNDGNNNNKNEEVDYSTTTTSATTTKTKVLVLGGTGFVGSEVCKQLSSLDINYIATSRDGRGNTKALDFTTTTTTTNSSSSSSSSSSSIDIAREVQDLISTNGCTAVISCIGAIGTQNDDIVNGGTGLAAIGARAAGVKQFVYISVAPEVRESAKGIGFLTKYMEGKKFSEDTIKANFSNGGDNNSGGGGGDYGYTIIEPTFIYGGDKFELNPPRVADGYGKIVEGILSTKPFRVAASISPGIIGVALEPPVKVSSVAGAAISACLGLTQGSTSSTSTAILDTYDKINAASKLTSTN